MVALTVYTNATATTTLTTASGLTTTAPAASASVATTVAKSTGYIELRSITAATVLSANGIAATPSGNGWLFDVTTLAGQQILAGTWSPSIRVSSSSTATTAAFFYRAHIYNAGTYSLIGTFSTTAAVVNTVANTPTTLTAFANTTGIAARNLVTGDKLYVEVYANVTVSSGSTTGTISLYKNGGAADSLVTPGYQAPVAPGAVTGLTATPTAYSTTQIDLAWNVPTAVGSGITGYKIYRSVGTSTNNGSAGPFTLLYNSVGQIGALGQSYADTPLTTSIGYSYYVVASTGADGPASATASAYTNKTVNVPPTSLGLVASDTAATLTSSAGAFSMTTTFTKAVPAASVLLYWVRFVQNVAEAVAPNVTNYTDSAGNVSNAGVGAAPPVCANGPATAQTLLGFCLPIVTTSALAVGQTASFGWTTTAASAVNAIISCYAFTGGGFTNGVDRGGFSGAASQFIASGSAGLLTGGLADSAGSMFHGLCSWDNAGTADTFTDDAAWTSQTSVEPATGVAVHSSIYSPASYAGSASGPSWAWTLATSRTFMNGMVGIAPTTVAPYSPPGGGLTPRRRVGKFSF